MNDKKSLLFWMLTILITLAGCAMPGEGSTGDEAAAIASRPPTEETAAIDVADSPIPPTITSTHIPSPIPPTVAPPHTASPVPPTATPEPTATPSDPFALISQDHLLSFLEDLATIQPYSGWRNSASQGEAEARAFAGGILSGLSYLQELGLELEEETFRVFLGTELRDTRLHLTVGGQEVEIPADGLRGPRDDADQARRFDSDGELNDDEPDPTVVEGKVVAIDSLDRLKTLEQDDVRGKVVLLDYALVDRSVMNTQEAVDRATELLEKGPAGLVLITTFSNTKGVSHGAFVGDGSALTWVETQPVVPVLYARLEDLAPAGVESWDDLGNVEAARLTWDADVFGPGTSGNLVARIPGADPERAIILGAHIDSPNAPGAMDDGSGSAILLEVARVLDEARVQPPADLYLVWFGSEEIGLYGAYNFIASHGELLDRTEAMLQIDCLTRPLDGVPADLRLVTWPYGRHGDGRMVWPETLAQLAAKKRVAAVPYAAYHVYSDNTPFGGFDVPHADLIYEPVVGADVSVHYAGHLHDPYDRVDLAREVGDVFEEMTRVALLAALEASQQEIPQRVTPKPDRRALFVASHTEPAHMTPAGFTEMGMALAMAGFDVDMVPYGQAVHPSDLEDADLVVVLPVLDYAPAGSDGGYDEAWTTEEVDALEAYAAGGGLLILTNSRHRLKYGNSILDPNEDWADANALAERFGATYQDGAIEVTQAVIAEEHPLVEGVQVLEMGAGNGVPFHLADGEGLVLARGGKEPVAVLLDYGPDGGQVLILADVGILTAGWSEPLNLPFWRNLARYARSR